MRDTEMVSRSPSRDDDGRPKEDVRLACPSQEELNLVEAVPYGLLVVDALGTILFATGRIFQLFGYAPKELLGGRIETLVPERHRSPHESHSRVHNQAPSLPAMGLAQDLIGRHKDGSEFPIEIGLNPVRWNGAIRTLAAVTDISIHKKLELELRQANARLEEFTYVASHDLKSPLRGIADLIEWITDDLGDRATHEIRHNLERMNIRVNRMYSMIDDLLVYARATRASAELVTIEPRSLLDGILDLQPMAEGFEVRVTVRASPFKAARTPLETVLRNLVSNAIQHHDRARGTIELTLSEDGSDCLFSVADDGPGIASHAQERVFNLFQTASAAQRRGSGIGLALAKRLVECHGGRIEIESVDGRRGTTFRFWWPRF